MRMPSNGLNGLELAETEPWEQAVTGGELPDELEGVIRRFVVLPRWGAEALAQWVVHTYLHGVSATRPGVGCYGVDGRSRVKTPQESGGWNGGSGLFYYHAYE